MRLNLDKIKHPIHCYYPASGQKNFNYLRHGCLYHENIRIIEHPIEKEGIVEEDKFKIEAKFLKHGVDNIGWRITEPDRVKFNKELLKEYKIFGPDVKKLEIQKKLFINEKTVNLSDVSRIKKGDVLAVVLDTKICKQAIDLAKNATVLICESTYLNKDKCFAKKYMHMTALEAGLIAKKANAKLLILTHFSARYQNVLDFEKEAKQVFKNSIAAEDLKKIPFPKP